MTSKTITEFEYVMTVSKELEPGKWIAIVGKDIVAKGADASEVYSIAKSKYPKSEPFIMKVPTESEMLM